jgi:nucleotide-binding universal stress UspA family protein
MIDVRRILCPTDFSDLSRRALTHAVMLARWHGAKLTVLHIAPLMPMGAAFSPSGITAVTLDPRARERLLDDLRAFAMPSGVAQVAADFKVQDGPVVRGIVAQAREGAADLIVMGTHGRGGFERLVLGSVAETVLRKAPCPVFTVSGAAEGSAPHEPTELRHVLCAVDFSAASQEALRYALSLARRARAPLTVLHVLEWPEHDPVGHRPPDLAEYKRSFQQDAMEHLHAAVPVEARQGCEVSETVAVGTPWRQILRVAGEERADLVVLGVQGRGALDRRLFGSTAGHVVRQAACPVLTVRPAGHR